VDYMRLPIRTASRDSAGRVTVCQKHIDGQEPGFLHDNGNFLSRVAARHFVHHLTGFTINEHELISGEEWIPTLKQESDAIEWAARMHPRAVSIVKMRINIFNARRKHQDHVRLLRLALKEKGVL
jgi:hypothetical protein